MSTNTENRTGKSDFELEVTGLKIEQVLKDANEQDTLRLICDIASSQGVLTDALLERLEQHPVYGVLEEKDRFAVTGGLESLPKTPLKLLLNAIYDIIHQAHGFKPVPYVMNWRKLDRYARRMLGNDQPSNGQRVRQQANTA